MKTNPAGSKYPNALSQISVFVLLDVLGSANPTIPSYFLNTHWAYKNMANLESRFRKLNILETLPPSQFFLKTNEISRQAQTADDYVPFMDRGVSFLHLLPSLLPENRYNMDNNGEHLDMPTVRDWAKIMTGFALEWLDGMEVWPE
jgi:glutaminyl-peptide cyclotransferase